MLTTLIIVFLVAVPSVVFVACCLILANAMMEARK